MGPYKPNQYNTSLFPMEKACLGMHYITISTPLTFLLDFQTWLLAVGCWLLHGLITLIKYNYGCKGTGPTLKTKNKKKTYIPFSGQNNKRSKIELTQRNIAKSAIDF